MARRGLNYYLGCRDSYSYKSTKISKCNFLLSKTEVLRHLVGIAALEMSMIVTEKYVNSPDVH